MSTLQEAAKAADDMINDFVKDWMDVANLGFSSAQRPQDESADYWVFALAGNVAWAVAGLFPVTGITAAVMLSGAVIGSGTIDKVVGATKDKPPSGDKLLAGRIAESADAIEKELLQKRRNDNWELNLALFNLENANEYLDAKAYLWERKIFTRITYQNRREQLLKKMIATIESQLSSFAAQWKTWRGYYGSNWGQHPASKCIEQELSRYPYTTIGVDIKKIYDRCLASNPLPFRPVLNFPLEISTTSKGTKTPEVRDGRPISPKLKSSGSFPVPIES
jgi:hypothetical protein